VHLLQPLASPASPLECMKGGALRSGSICSACTHTHTLAPYHKSMDYGCPSPPSNLHASSSHYKRRPLSLQPPPSREHLEVRQAHPTCHAPWEVGAQVGQHQQEVVGWLRAYQRWPRDPHARLWCVGRAEAWPAFTQQRRPAAPGSARAGGIRTPAYDVWGGQGQGPHTPASSPIRTLPLPSPCLQCYQKW